MRVNIEDDFDLMKIADSGQCFRVRRFEDDTFRFISGDRVLYIRRCAADDIKENHGSTANSPVMKDVSGQSMTEDSISAAYEISCTSDEWRDIWTPYFDLDRSYHTLRERAADRHPFVSAAMEYGRGIRVLKQDPWEMLVTFIISQRKNIPAIASSVEKLSALCGRPIETDRETLYAFPEPAAVAALSEDELRGCSLGYRAPYVRDAAERVLSVELDLEGIAELPDEELFEALKTVRGVGNKVANCICLFAYARMARVPVDVWISRAIEDDCGGESPFELFGDDAGIIQQYVFYYEKNKA